MGNGRFFLLRDIESGCECVSRRAGEHVFGHVHEGVSGYWCDEGVMRVGRGVRKRVT